MKTKFFLILVITTFTTYLSFGQKVFELTSIQIKKLDSISLQDVPKSAPGIATGIVSNGKIIYEKVAGYANLKDSILITKDSRFNIASNGKQFTALQILVLIDEKKISLNDDIRKYLPTIYPKYSSKITIENLLNHTSGIRDVYDLWSLQGLTWWKKSFDNKTVLQLIEKQQELNFESNSKYLYSNSNYILLALVIEKVTGKTFVENTNELFLKLNMPNTSFESDHKKIRGQIAKAYFNFDTWTTYNWIWNVCGDGNLFSTLTDQLEWEKIIQGKPNNQIKKTIIEESQNLTNNSIFKNYGYGLEFGTYKGLNYKFHEGATGAWKATVTRFSDNISFITLTNTGKSTPDRQTRQMIDVVYNLTEKSNNFVTKPAKVGSFVSDEDIIGTYQTDNNFTFQFEKRDNVIYLKRIGRNDVGLEREADNIFSQTYDKDFKQEFKKNEKGEMTVTVYYTSHSPYTLIKSNSNWNNFNFKSINGRFKNIETNVDIKIKHINDKNYEIKSGNQNVTKGLLITPTKLLVDNYVLEIEDKVDVPKIILLSANRIEKVKFIRVK